MKKFIFVLFALAMSILCLHAQNCNPPTGLSANVHSPEWRNVSLSWTVVTDATQQVFGYGTTNSSSMSVGGDFTAVIRLTPTELATYGNRYLSAVQFKPGMSQSECDYYLTIWQGGSIDWTDTTVDPGTMVCNQFVTQSLAIGSLNTVPLDTAVAIDPTQELWIGVHAIRLVSSGFPIGASYNPSVNYKGNIVYNGNIWYELSLSSQPNNTNWYIFAVLTESSHLLSQYNIYRDNSLIATTSGTSYIDNLDYDGEYTYSVSAEYANGCESNSISATVVMNDNCFINTFPYTENFDGVTGTTASTLVSHVLPECWSWINHGASYPGYPIVYNNSSYASSGTNSLRFYVYNTSADNTTYADQYAILPPIDINVQPVNALQLEFDAKCGSTTSTYQLFMEVGVMTSLSDVSTFVPVDTIQCNGNVYANYVVNFSQYTGGGQYIAFRVPKIFTGGTVYNSGVVDNILLDIIPTCPKPTDLTVDATLTTEQSITVSWTENGGAMEWEVEYGPTGFVLGQGTTINSTSTTATIYNLSAATPYQIYVRSICGTGDTSNYSPSITASTACGVLSELPYVQNFDSYVGSTSGTTANLSQSCWTPITTGTISTYAGYPIIYNSATYAQSGANTLRFYTYYTSTYGDEYAVMPAVDVNVHPINTLQVEFAASKYSTYFLNLIVGVMDDSASVSSFVPVDTIDIPTTATGSEYSTYIVSFENYTGNGSRIAFMAPRPASSYNAGYVDDIILSVIPNCKKPLSVTTTAISYNEATIDWTPFGDETDWDVVVVPAGNAVESGNIEYASEHPFTITNLTESTNYDVYVRANCGNEVSPWANVYTFKTRCAPTSNLPFTENFDSYPAATAAASGVIPTCWDRTTNYSSNYPYIYSTQHASGTGCLYFYTTTTYYCTAVSPALDLSQYAAGELALSFKALKTSSTYGYLDIYIATNPDYDSTFTLLKALTPADYDGVSQWTDFSILLNEQYTEPVYLVMHAPATATSYVCIDDIMIGEVPECTSPRGVHVSNIHGANAQVNWSEAWYGADSYTVEYTEAGADNWSAPETVTGTSYLLTDLDPLTTYEVRVTSSCASGTADPVITQFQTICIIPDDVTIGTGTSTSYYIPFYGAYQYSYTQQIYTAAEMHNEAKDINSIAFQYTGESAITRTVDIYLLNTTKSALDSAWAPMTGAQLVYSGDITMNANAAENNWNRIILDSVFHYDGISNLLIAVNNKSTVSAGTSATTRTFKHTSATGKGRYVYGGSTAVVPYNPFNMTATGTSYAYHNNIIFGSCDNTTTCAAPFVSVESISDESVTLSWVPGYQETSWEMEYKAQSDAGWTSEGVVTSSPYTISGLSTNTQYEFRLRALCTDTSAWATVSARTFCTSINVPYTQDFETATGSGAGNFIDCWMRGTNYTTAYPYTYSSQSHSGTYSLYFYGTASYYSYASTPQFDESVQMDSLQIRFWARKASAAYQIQVGIMDNPYDYSTFTLLGTFSPAENNNWEEMQINTSGYQGNGRFVAFRIPNQITSYMYVDDILIQYIPNCPRVQDVTTVNLQAHQTDITWTSSSVASAWYYTYGLKDSVEFDISTAEIAYNDTISLTELMSNTEYDVLIMTSCNNGEESEVVKYTFTTLCDPISSLPYRESFDTYGGSGSAYYPSCWDRTYISSSSTTTSYPYIYSTYFNSAPASLYFYGLTSSNTSSVAIMQPFADEIAVNALQVDFTLRTATLTNYMLVGVMTDPTNTATFTVVDTVFCTATSDFEPKSVSLATYTGTGKYLAFKCSGSLYMDDLVVDYIPACDNPTDMVISGITQTSATVTWSAGSTEDTWEVYVVPTGSSLFDETPVIVTDSTYYISNLTAASNYDVYVRALCPSGQGHSGYLVETFATACYAISTLPITENFDSYTGATTGTTNNLPNCWNFINHGTLSSYVGYPIIYTSSSYSESGLNSLRFYTYSASTYSPQYAILPEINTSVIPINTLSIEFDIRKYSTSYYSFVLEVGVMTDPSVDSTFEAIDTLEITSTEYSHEVIYLDSYTGTGRYIALKATQPATSYNAGMVDNIVIDLMPNCLRVNDVNATDVSSNSATINWTPSGNESMWTIQYKPASDTTWLTESSNTNSYPLTGLTTNTTYNVQIIADCGSSQSVPSNTYTFTTDCEDLITLPITENFDGYTATTSGTVVNLPVCWRQMNLGYTSSSYTAYPIMYNSSTYAYSGTNSLRFYSYTSGSTCYGNEWAILRGIDTTVIPIQSLQLNMKARKYSTSYSFNLIVGVMSDYNDTTTFVPVATVSPADAVYEDVTVYFRQYAGGGKYIAMKIDAPTTSYNAGHIDDLVISLAPTCLPVQNLTTTSVTENSISVAWDPIGEETNWNICYRADGDTTWICDVAANTPTYTLSNLQPSTTYYFRVQPDCGNDDVAPFSSILSVTTQCVALSTLPYFENFDSYTGTTYNAAGPTPNCWDTYTDNSSRPAPHIIGSGSYYYPQSQPNALSFVGGSPSTNAIAVLPEFTAPLNTLQVTFAYRMENAAQGTLKVGYITNNGDMVGSFVEVASITGTTTISLDTVDFSAVTSAGRIAFLWNYTGSIFYSCNIDNVGVSEFIVPVVCDAPTALAADNITQTAATLNWTAGGSETAWNLQYKTASEATWSNSIVINNAPTYALSGLTASTSYHVRVQAACDADHTSDWASTTFTTLAEDQCPAPTNLHTTDLTKNSVTLAWNQAAGTANEWEINYKSDAASAWTNITVSANPYTITDLTPETTYQAHVIAHCVNGTNSEASETITFTTAPDGVNDYVLDNMTVLYPNPTKGELRIENGELSIEKVDVYDVYGKLLMTMEVNGNVAVVDATSFAAGIYFAKVQTENGVVTKRFVKK